MILLVTECTYLFYSLVNFFCIHNITGGLFLGSLVSLPQVYYCNFNLKIN